MENIKYDPNPAPTDDSDVKRYVYDEFQRIRDALDITPRWDDLRFPASAGVAIAGKVPGQDADGTLLFDSAKTETIAMVAQMPHAWKVGSEIDMHVHWMKTSSAAGNVLWQVEYKQAPIGGVMDAAFTTSSNATVISLLTDNDTLDEHLITDVAEVDMAGYGISHCIVILVSRVGGDALDTYGADAKLLEFDIHYQIDSFGSDLEYIKR